MRDICLGTALMDAANRRQYIQHWLSNGTLKADPDAPPGLLRRMAAWVGKILRFSKAAGKHLADGAKEATDAMQAERMAICKKCPAFNDQNAECGVCGCNLKTKTRWRTSACPSEKW